MKVAAEVEERLWQICRKAPLTLTLGEIGGGVRGKVDPSAPFVTPRSRDWCGRERERRISVEKLHFGV